MRKLKERSGYFLRFPSKERGNEWPSLYAEDYVGQLLCAEGFRGSHQIRDWRIKLGNFKKIPRTVLCLSLCRQTPV